MPDLIGSRLAIFTHPETGHEVWAQWRADLEKLILECQDAPTVDLIALVMGSFGHRAGRFVSWDGCSEEDATAVVRGIAGEGWGGW